MHLLALLAGIYLMIFVVEPVAVPNHVLAQHFYGLPWGADRRLHRDRPEFIHQILQRKDFFPQLNEAIKGGQRIQNDQRKISPPLMHIQHYGTSAYNLKNAKPPSTGYQPVFQHKSNTTQTRNISKVRYISAEHLHARRNNTHRIKKINENHSTKKVNEHYPSNKVNENHPTKKIYHWSKWIPSPNSSVESSSKINEGLYWKPSVKITQRSGPDEISTENKVFNLTGRATSVQLKDVLI